MFRRLMFAVVVFVLGLVVGNEIGRTNAPVKFQENVNHAQVANEQYNSRGQQSYEDFSRKVHDLVIAGETKPTTTISVENK